MHTGERRIGRRVGGALALLLMFSIGFGWFVSRAGAAAGTIAISSDLGSSANCAATGSGAPAVYQGGKLQIFFDYFSETEGIYSDLTFPDGRVFTISNATAQLDGVIDQPSNYLSLFAPDTYVVTNVAGSSERVVQVPGEWPYGCYTISGYGVTSHKRAVSSFVVIPGGGPAQNRGPASFSVTLRGSDAASGVQGSIVDLYGGGFPGNDLVSIWVTAPDGTVLDYPAQLSTSDGGEFTSSFTFGGQNPVGGYVFTALSARTGLRLFAPFSLSSPAVVERGPADVRVSLPTDAGAPQRSTFQIQGTRYEPNEQIVVWMTFPDGAVRTFSNGSPLGSPLFSDAAGDFYVEFYLDERLPTGYYQITAKGVRSKQIAIAGFNLEQNSGIDSPAHDPDLFPPANVPASELPGPAQTDPDALPREPLDPALDGVPGPTVP